MTGMSCPRKRSGRGFDDLDAGTTSAVQPTMARTDIHRPSTVIPSDYECVLSYIIPGSDPFERWNTDLAVEAYRKAREAGKRTFGGLGRCGFCGACFRYGDVWEHIPTGDLINVGHDCATKYELLADRPEFDAKVASLQARRQALKEASRRSRRFIAWCEANPAVASAFEGVCDGAGDREAVILRDLASKCREYGSLSPKQIEFAISLGSRRMSPQPPPKPEEVKVSAPISESRQTIRGVLVSKKTYKGVYGTSIKGTVKVTTAEGVWLAWGTLPNSLWDYTNHVSPEVGDTIELTAWLHAGKEPHFVFFKRPTRACILSKAGVAA